MAKYGPSNADILVHAYKEGIASALGHDTCLSFKDWECELSGDPSDPSGCSVVASWKAASVDAKYYIKQDKEYTGEKIDKNKADIEKNTTKHILKPDNNPTIEFASTEITGTADKGEITGELTLNGNTKPVKIAVEKVDGNYKCTAEVNMGEFGIKQFTAALGALKIKQKVKVFLNTK